MALCQTNTPWCLYYKKLSSMLVHLFNWLIIQGFIAKLTKSNTPSICTGWRWVWQNVKCSRWILQQWLLRLTLCWGASMRCVRPFGSICLFLSGPWKAELLPAQNVCVHRSLYAYVKQSWTKSRLRTSSCMRLTDRRPDRWAHPVRCQVTKCCVCALRGMLNCSLSVELYIVWVMC